MVTLKIATARLDAQLSVCNIKGTPATACLLLLIDMDDVLHSKIKNIKLSPWYFAVHWASIQLQEKITDMEQLGVDPTYDIRQLQQLQDLEQFLKMTWDQWMDGIEARQTAREVQ